MFELICFLGASIVALGIGLVVQSLSNIKTRTLAQGANKGVKSLDKEVLNLRIKVAKLEAAVEVVEERKRKAEKEQRDLERRMEKKREAASAILRGEMEREIMEGFNNG